MKYYTAQCNGFVGTFRRTDIFFLYINSAGTFRRTDIFFLYISWNIILYSVMGLLGHFGGQTYSSYTSIQHPPKPNSVTLKMKATSFLETLVQTHSTLSKILNNAHHENLKIRHNLCRKLTRSYEAPKFLNFPNFCLQISIRYRSVPPNNLQVIFFPQ
jgi:hypothetical protein